MQFPYPVTQVATPENTVSLTAYVQYVVNAINNKTVIPLGDFGGPTLFWFQTLNNGLGSIIYTSFDRHTTLGLSSYMVRYGAASTIGQVIFGPYPKSQIDLQFPVLPKIPTPGKFLGKVIPE